MVQGPDGSKQPLIRAENELSYLNFIEIKVFGSLVCS